MPVFGAKDREILHIQEHLLHRDLRRCGVEYDEGLFHVDLPPQGHSDQNQAFGSEYRATK